MLLFIIYLPLDNIFPPNLGCKLEKGSFLTLPNNKFIGLPEAEISGVGGKKAPPHPHAICKNNVPYEALRYFSIYLKLC